VTDDTIIRRRKYVADRLLAETRLYAETKKLAHDASAPVDSRARAAAFLEPQRKRIKFWGDTLLQLAAAVEAPARAQ
jgi:hypothetical protein